jgi:hypothetical protein
VALDFLDQGLEGTSHEGGDDLGAVLSVLGEVASDLGEPDDVDEQDGRCEDTTGRSTRSALEDEVGDQPTHDANVRSHRTSSTGGRSCNSISRSSIIS